jgi:ribosome-associated protein
MLDPTSVSVASIRTAALAPDPKMDRSLALVLAAAEAAADRKGGDPVVIKVGEVAYLADYFLIVSGFSPVQVKAIARAIEIRLLEQFGRLPIGKEGAAESRWILQDYGEIVVHIFLPEERERYNLEAFWGHGEVIDWASLLVAQPQGQAS